MSDIGTLFDRDPLSLTRPDIDAMIEHFRKARAQFNLGDKTAGAAKKTRVVKAPAVEIDLDDLLSVKPK